MAARADPELEADGIEVCVTEAADGLDGINDRRAELGLPLLVVKKYCKTETAR